LVCGVIAAISLGVAGQAARLAHAESVRGPSQAEIAAAATAGIAQRWERLSLGTIFPQYIGYASDQQTRETATLLSISAGDSCDDALDGTADGVADSFGCVAAMRASYADQLGGTVVTVAVVVFPDSNAASGFAAGMPRGEYPATGLHAFALPGTAAALFSDAARQVSAVRVSGPYAVLAVAGYADGRPASQAAEPRPSVFAGPMSSIMAAVVGVLAKPQPVQCGSAEWTC
jgi:hypothetical protein